MNFKILGEESKNRLLKEGTWSSDSYWLETFVIKNYCAMKMWRLGDYTNSKLVVLSAL